MMKMLRGINAKFAAKRRVYLDFASAAPLSAAAKEAMMNVWQYPQANGSAIHSEGVMMRQIVEDWREKAARAVSVKSEQVIFTSGGTEANNLAIRGTVRSLQAAGRPLEEMEIISTAIEHPATANTLRYLGSKGVMIRRLAVDESGRLDQAALKEAVNNKTVLVCVSYVNSEIGTIEDVAAIGRLLQRTGSPALLFVDAAQAPLWLSCHMPRLRADLLSLDASKCGGPQGIGMLIRSRRSNLKPVIFGGGQEGGLRPGTEPVALIAGGVAAFCAAQAGFKERAQKVSAVRDQGLAMIKEKIPSAIVNGASGLDRVANNMNISVPGLDSEFAVVALDAGGVSASTKSACSSAGGGQSEVVMAISGDAARAASTLRFTLGPETTANDIELMIKVLLRHLDNSSF